MLTFRHRSTHKCRTCATVLVRRSTTACAHHLKPSYRCAYRRSDLRLSSPRHRATPSDVAFQYSYEVRKDLEVNHFCASFDSAMSIRAAFLLGIGLSMSLIEHGTATGPMWCSRDVYGSPNIQNCVSALANLKLNDQTRRLFVEQQLRVTTPRGDWPWIKDPRPQQSRQAIVQVPKWWSFGK